jgi:hypothetical protein
MLLLLFALIPLLVAPLIVDPSGAVEDVMTALEWPRQSRMGRRSTM